MFFKNFVDTNNLPFSSYIEAIRNVGNWGGDLEVQAACELYGKKIIVYDYDSNSKKLKLRRSLHEEMQGSGNPINLIYTENHFDVLVKNPISNHNSQQYFSNFSLNSINPEPPLAKDHKTQQ